MSPAPQSSGRRRTSVAVVATLTIIASFVVWSVPAAPAGAVEGYESRGAVATTVDDTWDALSANAQVGSVRTRHWAETVLRYPRAVRAGQQFGYERCVWRLHFEEIGGYETSIRNMALDGVWHDLGGEYFTQDSRTINWWVCNSYTATAPAAGSSSLTIPAVSVQQYGGVGYAGSCCPTWGRTWTSWTTDNTITFDAVYTAPVARDDGPVLVRPGDTVTTAPLVNDDGFIGGSGVQLGTATSKTISTQAVNGTCTWVGDDTVYVNNGTPGTDSCTYRLNQAETDGESPGNEPVAATVSFNVDRPPVAAEDLATTGENDPIVVDVLVNDTDPEEGPLTVTSATATPGEGSVSVVDNAVRFDPGADFDHLAPGASRTTRIDYTVTDVAGWTDSSQITMTVTGRYDLPVAVADEVDADEDGPSVAFDPRSNDRADDGNPFWIRAVDDAATIGVVSHGDEEITFDPDGRWEHLAEGETATTTIGYSISDDVSPDEWSDAAVTVTVHGSNDAPTAVDDTARVDEKSVVDIDVAVNDTDPDTSDELAAVDAWLVDAEDPGDVEVVGGRVQFSAAHGFDHLGVGETRRIELGYEVTDPHGERSEATVVVTVHGVNDDPTATPNALTVDEDGPTGSVEVIGGDDPDLDPDTNDVLTVASVSDPARGVASHGATEVSFDPADDFHHLAVGASATETFSYTAIDSFGGSASATVTVTVLGANDAPVATADVLDVHEDGGPETLDVLTNDVDVDDGSRISLVSLDVGEFRDFPALPTVDGSAVTFDPDGRFDSLSAGEVAVLEVRYTIVDEHGAEAVGTLEIRVHGVNDSPVGSPAQRTADEDSVVSFDDLAASASDVDRLDELVVTALDDGDTLASVTLVGGVVTYDPRAVFDHLDVGETADDSFSVTVSDGHGGVTTLEVDVIVHGRNDAPSAVDDVAITDEDTTVRVDVTANDADAEGGELVVQELLTDLTLSAVRLVDGFVEIDPRVAFNALPEGDSVIDTVGYVVTDEHGATSVAQLVVTITGVNDAPDGAELTLSTDEDTQGWVDAGDSSTDPDDDATITATELRSAPSTGIATLTGNRAEFDPAGDHEHLAVGERATDRFEVALDDEHGATGTAAVLVTVHGVNDAPTANPDRLAVQDRRTPTLDVLANDSDPDTSDRLRIASVAGAGVGEVRIDGGEIRWIVGEAFFSVGPGEELVRGFVYTITDDNGGTATASGEFRLTRTVDNELDSDGDGIPDWYELDRDAEDDDARTRGEARDGAPLRLPDELPHCPEPNGLLDIDGSTLSAGATVGVSGSTPWMMHSRVSYFVCSTPTLLDRVDAGADGSAATSLTLPKDLAPGEHTVIGIGLSPDGDALVQTGRVTVEPARSDTAPAPTSLAFTGSEAPGHIALAGLLLSGGVVALLASCRRDRRRFTTSQPS